jgi:hypothetical protein
MIRPDVVDRAVAAIKGYAQYQYFFDHLDSPEWLEPLAGRGFFKEPPAPQEVDEQHVRLPFWPESRYLVRMAAIPEAQQTVTRLVSAIPKSSNSRVYDDVVDVALALPAQYAARLLDQIAAGLQLPIKLTLEFRLGDLIKLLAVGGQPDAALRLTRLALALSSDPRPERQDREKRLLSLEPQPLIRDWSYASVIETSLKSLVEAAGFGAVRLFVDLLDEAIRLSRRKSTEPDDEDYLYITCPDIEHASDRDNTPVLLIVAVRNATVQLIATDSGHFAAVMDIIDSKNWATFRRIKLHLCAVFPELGLPRAEAMLTDPGILLRGSLQHEVVVLLKKSFSRFSDEPQKRILSIMDTGLSDDAHRRWLEFLEQPVTDENINRLRDMGRRDRFAILQGQLPLEYQQKLEMLIAALGDPRALGEPTIRSFGAVGAQSPKSDTEMAAMSVHEIFEFASSWKPGTDIFQPTAEGFAKALEARVSKDPASFLAHTKRFEALDPTYVRALFSGIQNALKAKLILDWRPVLELALWVVQQPREIPDRKGGLMVTDPDWGWTRNGILDLLNTGFDLSLPGHLSYGLHELVWSVLQPLTEDPFPSTDDEGGKKFDPGSLSINSTRGRAMHAALEYARWRRLLTDADRKAADKPLLSFSDMPEVRDVLEKHLDVASEPTLTIRSVYGHHLNLIAALDFEWLSGNLHKIFPSDDSLRFDAAWGDYITTNEPSAPLLPVLVPFIERALEHFGREPISQRHRDPASALAEHLMVYYWQGRINVDTPASLLRKFYERAPDDARARAIWYVGVSVPRWTDAPSEAYARLQNLFAERLAAAKRSSSPAAFQKELKNFGYWFISEKFDERWSMDMLVASLGIAMEADPEMSVVKRLVDLSPRYSIECVAALRLMIDGDRDGWLLVGVEDDARRVLKGAIDSGNADGLQAARRLIEDLIAKGQFGFRQLIA